jgi:uncharacterized membrane protein
MNRQIAGFVVHLAATWWMVGLIWMVQIVHYPLFAEVGELSFANYENEHRRLITWIVLAPMVIELGSAYYFWRFPPLGLPKREFLFAGLLVGVIWLSTALLQVPAHQSLALGFDAAVHEQLVTSNWIRTIAWTARALFTLRWLMLCLGSAERAE